MVMTGALFVINGRDRMRLSFYTRNVRFGHIASSLLFRLPSSILLALNYFGIYEFASRIGTDPVLTVMVFHRCGEED